MRLKPMHFTAIRIQIFAGKGEVGTFTREMKYIFEG